MLSYCFGDLIHEINLESKATSQDSYGSSSGSWSTEITARRCKVTTNPSVEIAQGQQVQLVGSYIIGLRYDANFTEKKRVVWGSKTLNIVSVSYDDVKFWMELICKEDI